jgi:hypothetical protein
MTWGVVEGARVGVPDFHPTASPIYGTAWELRPKSCVEAALVARNRSGLFSCKRARFHWPEAQLGTL